MSVNEKRALVTGAAGSIGSVAVRDLLSRGYGVSGMDILQCCKSKK
jgi:nucleoside-diphosphate-sugar epimerase